MVISSCFLRTVDRRTAVEQLFERLRRTIKYRGHHPRNEDVHGDANSAENRRKIRLSGAVTPARHLLKDTRSRSSIAMEFNKLVFAGLAVGCLAAAAGGSYLAVRQNQSAVATDAREASATACSLASPASPDVTRFTRNRIRRRDFAGAGEARAPGCAARRLRQCVVLPRCPARRRARPGRDDACDSPFDSRRSARHADRRSLRTDV